MSIELIGGDTPVRIVVAERASKDAAALIAAVKRSLPASVVVGRVDSLESTRRALIDTHPDVLLLDVDLHGICEERTYHELRSATGDAAVVVVTRPSTRKYGLEAVLCGADDYVVKGPAAGRDVGEAVLVALMRKRAAVQERRNEELQRLDAVSRLGRGIAHHFSNLTQIVMGYAMLARQTTGLPSDVLYALDAIAKAAQRSKILTRHLIDFTSSREDSSGCIDAADVLRKVVEECSTFLPTDIDLEASFEDAGCSVEIDRLELEQVLMELILNAFDATHSFGTVTVTISRFRPALVDGSQSGAEQVLIAVSDTGSGMPADVARRALEPFFTTKEVGQGAGLGLSAVHGIVRRAGGFVSVSSVPGHGTTVRVHLPLAKADH